MEAMNENGMKLGPNDDQWIEVNHIKLDQWPYAMKHEYKHAFRSIKTNHGLGFSSQSSKSSNNNDLKPRSSQYKQSINVMNQLRVSNTLMQVKWFMNLPDQELGFGVKWTSRCNLQDLRLLASRVLMNPESKSQPTTTHEYTLSLIRVSNTT